MARPVLLPFKKKKKTFGQASAWHGIPQCPSAVPLGTLYVGSSARCHCFCALRSRWLTSGPSSGLLALCLARPLPGYSYPSICVSRSPELCTSLLRPGVLHWWVVLGQALYLLACLRSILALSSSRFCCSCRASWAPGLCLALVLSTARCVVTSFSIPHRHYPGSPCLHLARGLPRTLTLPVLPRFLFSFYSWIFMSALLLILLVLPPTRLRFP